MVMDEYAQAKKGRLRFQRLLVGVGISILLIGILISAFIYYNSEVETDADRAIGYESLGGDSYAVIPANSKLYQQGLEKIGGKSMLVSVELQTWFSRLWVGRNLAFTVVTLSFACSLACFLIAWLISLESPEAPRSLSG